MNWYEGSNQAWGRFHSPHAPALLGFDNDIHGYCRGSCDNANVNILNLLSGNVKYNTCRNFEWQARRRLVAPALHLLHLPQRFYL